MKRVTIEKKSKLPIFSISRDDFAVFISSILKLFPEESPEIALRKPTFTINIKLKNGEISFDNLKDFLSENELKGYYDNFSLRMSNHKNSIYLNRTRLFNRYYISTNADTNFWISGTTDEVIALLSKHKPWYSFLYLINFPFIFVFLTYVLFVSYYFLFKYVDSGIRNYINLEDFAFYGTIFFLTLGLISYLNNTFLPSAKLIMTDDRNIEKYPVKTSILIAVISTFVALLSYFKK